MRVAIDGQTLSTPDADRGIGVFFKSLLRHLPEVPDARFELLRWGPAAPGLPPQEDLPSFRLSDAGPVGTGDSTAPLTRSEARALAVRRFVREHGCDLLFTPNALQQWVDLLPRPGLAPLVALVHDLTPLVLPDIFLGPGNASFEAFYRERLGRLINNATHLIANSEDTRQSFIRLLGYPENRITTVHCAVDPVFRADGDGETDRLFLESIQRNASPGQVPIVPGKYLLSVGGNNPKKNSERMFAALSRINPVRLGELPLVLAGPLEPKDWEQLRLLRDRHAPGLLLVRTGYLPDAALATLYRHARVLVFPSLHEGFGMPALEALACGCPVVASTTGGLPEVTAEAARLCDPYSVEAIAQAVDEVLNSESLRIQLRTRGLLRASQFSWRRTAFQTAEVFREVLRKQRGTNREGEKRGSRSSLPSLLWYSPLPPDPGGVSAYSASLLAEIRDEFNITLVREPELPPAEGLQGFSVITPERACATEADLCVYHMGNNLAQCAATYDALRTRPGLTLVHDLNIHAFLLEHLVRRNPPGLLRGAQLEAHPYFSALVEAHGEAGAAQAHRVLAEGGLPDIAQFPCHRLLTDSSTAVVTHSRWGRDRLEANGDPAPVWTLPLGIEHPLAPRAGSAEELRRDAGAGPDDLVLTCAGFLEPNRRLVSVILSLAELKRRAVSARLLLAGGVDPSHKAWLEAIARDHGVSDRVIWRGFLRDDNDFLASLAASDVVVHLRHPTNGESSATILRALSIGRPVIVSAADSYRELPEDCCWKVDADQTEIPLLSGYLETLARRPELRASMRAAARRHIALYHAWPEAARRFRQLIRNVLPREQPE